MSLAAHSEHLGFLYAVGKETERPLEVVQVRIGAPREDGLEDLAEDLPHLPEGGALTTMNRYLGTRDGPKNGAAQQFTGAVAPFPRLVGAGWVSAKRLVKIGSVGWRWLG